jgi:Tfp pilus assembly protein PilX
MRSRRSRQSGAALIVSLIMLGLITLLAIASFRLGKSNLLIVGNMQERDHALSAAQDGIEQVISSIQFTQTPADAIPNPCGAANTTCADVNGDGVVDLHVVLTPKCVAIQPIPVTALDFTNPQDAGCLIGTDQNFGVDGSASNNSMCANSVWDTQASVSNAKYVVNEGVAVRVPSSTVCP